MTLSIHTVIQVVEFWLRLATFLHEPLKQALLRILHDPNYNGLPINPQQLYTELSTKYQKKITKLKNKRILQQDQMDKLLPPNSNATDSSQFDITLICILIRNCTTLPAPLNGWDDNKPPPHDQSLAAFVIHAREWRNFVHHTEPKNITLTIFQQKWAEGATIIHKLGFQYDTNKLLNISLDPQHKTFLKPLFHYFKNVQDSLTKQHKALDQQQQTLTLQHNSLEQTVTTNTQNITHLTHDTTRNAQDIADLEKQQSKNTHDIADLIYQQQCAEQEQIFLKQQQKITEQTSDSNTKEIKNLTDQLNLTLDKVSSLLEQLEIIRDEVEDLKEKKFLSSGSHCLEEVLQKIEQLLTDQEHRRLLKNLGIEYEEGMTIQELLESVPWKDLKKELEMMRRYSVVEHIQKTTLITNALQTASNKLRKKYRKDLIKCLVEQPLSSTEMTEINVFREDIFIDLMVLPSSEVDRKWNNSDREALMEQQYLPKSTTHNAVDQIFTEDDELAFIRGIAGIGKSSLIDMFTFKWAKEELKTDIKVDFLFKFTCRELNNLSSKFSNLEELFKLNVKYKDIFRDITFDDLMEISDRVLVVIDGVDELKDIYLMGNPSCKNQLILDLIDPKAIWLPNHKSIVCGRPKACELVKRQFKCYHKTIEVCGFSEENVKNYIKKFFGEHHEQKGVAVQKLIESSYNLRSLSRVPVFLWVICNIYKEDKITAPINTYTELCFYSCLILLKKHFGEKSKNFTKLMDVVLDQDTMGVLYSIMVLSVKTYMDNKVVFTEDDIKSLNYSYHLEETGFITKYEGTNEIEPNYQFRHLVLQEFLCSLYICITKGISSYLSNRELSSCKPTILGIHRLLRMKDNNLFLKFYDSLTKINESHSSYLSKVSRPFNIVWFNRFVMKNTLEVPDQMFEEEKLIISTFNPVCSEFLAFYKESNIRELNVPKITSVDIRLLSSYKDYKNIGNLIKDLGINNNITIHESFLHNYIAIDNLSFAQLALGKEYDVTIFPIYSYLLEDVIYERSKATLFLDVQARNAPILTVEGLSYSTNRYLRGEIVKNARNVYLDYDGLGNINCLRTISAIIEVLAKEHSCKKILISSRVYDMCNERIDEAAHSLLQIVDQVEVSASTLRYRYLKNLL